MSSKNADCEPIDVAEAQERGKKRKSTSDASVDFNRAPVLKKPKFTTPPSIIVTNSKREKRSSARKAKKTFVCKFGNYRGYYGYRLDEHGQDPRIEMMKKEWFEKKRVMDIGCNTGVLTIGIAKKFGVRSMLGLDIDQSLIAGAKRNVGIVKAMREAGEGEEKGERRKMRGGAFVPSFLTPPTSSIDLNSSDSDNTECDFQFEAMNYLDRAKGNESFDTIMWYVQNQKEKKTEASIHPFFLPFAFLLLVSSPLFISSLLPLLTSFLSLSVIKWIHLNWGDEGLRKLLRNVFDDLAPNGFFILEIQPKSSYSKVKNLTPLIHAHYKANKILPDEIVKEAQSIGFSLLLTLLPPLSDSSPSGFSRPLHIFTKPSQKDSKALDE